MADCSLLCAIIERDAGTDSPSNPTKVEVWRPPCWRSLCFGRTNQKSFWGVLQSNHCIFFDLENLAIGWKMTVFQPLFQYRSGKTGIGVRNSWETQGGKRLAVMCFLCAFGPHRSYAGKILKFSRNSGFATLQCN